MMSQKFRSAYNVTVSEPAEHAHMGMAVKCILLPHMMRCDRTREGQGNEKLHLLPENLRKPLGAWP